MSSQDRRDAILRPTPRGPASHVAPDKTAVAVTNYPPKARFADDALPMSHRPTSA